MTQSLSQNARPKIGLFTAHRLKIKKYTGWERGFTLINNNIK